MNNLHRELAPISAAAWAEIEDEARHTFRRRIAGRRVVDMPEAAGYDFSAVGSGHVADVDSHTKGVTTRRRETYPVIELRAPFTVTRTAVDDVERGATDSDWDPVKKAAEQIAEAEDRTVFYGVDSIGIAGIVPRSTNAKVALPKEVGDYPGAVAKAINALRLVGVSGKYSLLLSAELYTAVAETTVHGYPVLNHLEGIVGEGSIVWAPALDGVLVVSERGGDPLISS